MLTFIIWPKFSFNREYPEMKTTFEVITQVSIYMYMYVIKLIWIAVYILIIVLEYTLSYTGEVSEAKYINLPMTR